MQIAIKKWRDCLVLPIPAHIATELKIEENSVIEVTFEGKRCVIKPTERSSKLKLEELLEKVTRDNLHEEIETAPFGGKEIW